MRLANRFQFVLPDSGPTETALQSVPLEPAAALALQRCGQAALYFRAPEALEQPGKRGKRGTKGEEKPNFCALQCHCRLMQVKIRVTTQ